MASRLYSRYPFFSIALLFFSASGLARAQNEAPAYDPFTEAAIMHVGFINTDCVRDTIFGYLDPDDPMLGWRAAFVRWGRAFDTEGTPLCDAGEYDSAITASRRVDTTRIIYPDWVRLTCVLSVQRYNANDSLDDAVFWLRGADSVGERGVIDTARSLVVFGQRGLDTLSSIDLSTIGEFKGEPFFAMELKRGRELVNPKRRDMTRKESRELVRVDKDVLKKDEKKDTGRDSAEAPEPQLTSAVAGDPTFSARVYPNPAIYTTNVEVNPLPPGLYVVEVVAVNGEGVWRGEVTLEETGEIFRTVDLGDLSSGYYVVRVHSREKVIGTYPIIVVR